MEPFGFVDNEIWTSSKKFLITDFGNIPRPPVARSNFQKERVRWPTAGIG